MEKTRNEISNYPTTCLTVIVYCSDLNKIYIISLFIYDIYIGRKVMTIAHLIKYKRGDNINIKYTRGDNIYISNIKGEIIHILRQHFTF
jgi:hypothetical protein